LGLGNDRCLRVREDAIEAAKDDQRQHDSLILRRPIGAAQQIGDVPDQVGKVSMSGHQALVPFFSAWAESRSYSSTDRTTTTGLPYLSMETGAARARSISRPKPFLASRADMCCMCPSRVGATLAMI